MLIITKELAKIAHVKHRLEKHGGEDVPAVDIKILYRASNDVLAHFSDTLKPSLYWLNESVQGQVIRDANYLPNIKNPKIAPLKWRDEYENVTFRIHHGVRDEDDMVFVEANVDSFVITPMEGGSVTIEFSVRALLADNSMDALIHIENTEVHVSLLEEEDPQGDMLKDAA